MPNKKALKIIQINTVPNGSTGCIMMSIHKQLIKDGYDSYVVWGRGRKAQNNHEIYMNDKIGVYFHILYSRLTGKTGFASKRATKNLLKKLDEIKPDIIHLHNLHGYYINIELLFNYIKKNNIKTIWTLHDCWAFTGHCAYFEISNCNCCKGEKCIDIKSYPKSIKNNSLWCYQKKKLLFSDIKDMTIITPSQWLMTLVNNSYL
jgi:glycogen synthase